MTRGPFWSWAAPGPATVAPSRAGHGWWALGVAETPRAVDSRADGLGEEEASRRQPPTPRAGGRRRLRVLGELVESLGEPLQLLLIAVAIV